MDWLASTALGMVSYTEKKEKFAVIKNLLQKVFMILCDRKETTKVLDSLWSIMRYVNTQSKWYSIQRVRVARCGARCAKNVSAFVARTIMSA